MAGEEGSVSYLAESDYIENYFAEADYIYTYYAQPINFTPYDTINFTPYVPELYFYESGGERVFVPEGDAQATHKLTGYNTVGQHEVGYRVIGERIIGWTSQTYGLWAGQSNDAGTVTISNDNENFYILINTNATADLQDVHIDVYGDAASLPTKRPAPGQAAYVVEGINADSVEVVLPIADLADLEDYYFIIHAALIEDAVGSASGESNAGETAYAAGNETPSFNGKGAWFYAVGYTLNAVYEDITEPLFEDVTEDVVVELDTRAPAPQPQPESGSWGEETAWAGNTAGAGNAWWFYFDASGPATQNIYAGQNLVPGASIVYDAAAGTFTVSPGPNLRYQDKAENLKVEAYAEIPSVRPAAGHFTYKSTDEFFVQLAPEDQNRPFYAIHLDVEVLSN